MQKRDMERKEIERAKLQAKLQREKKARLCEEAKKKIRFIEESKGMPMAREGSEGELYWISDEERDETEAYWRNRTKKFCE
jgi:hypothetical protein